MAVTGCVACVKYLMFAFNFLFWLCGCALLGVGLWLCFEPSVQQYATASGDLKEYYIAVYVIIGVGGLMMLVGFLGCCGACMENTVLLGMFFTFLLLICVAEVGGGIWCYLNREQLKSIVEKGILSTIREAYQEDNQVIVKAVDNMQQQLKCCGAVGPNDWEDSAYGRLPDSCCRGETEGCTEGISFPITLLTVYNEGCTSALFKMLEDNAVLVAGLAIGIGAVQLLGMLFSLCLCCAIRRADREKSYPL
ncbi:CD9 antigen-like isoform X2 [Acanthaster planci]|uniref:Tetraspanin n=1 Tax=Acanthaster planci TaxID=133434 RepID=A0A8B7XS46_ACAPL|nr:CD9 antigen-like isoform X2 [Acanthaster planci]